ncbi:MAG TPA: hypothetical protein VFT95_22080, partial [Micromonosporaceae bacterium]|nr:hypothetical protein [Micromonosporaceae bacterium]
QAGFRVTAADPDPPAGRTFDAALVLGSALGGLVANDRMLTALARYAGCLRPGGLMLLDLVDGQTVLGARLPGRGLRELAGPDGRRMIGYADEVDTDEQVYRLTVRTWRLAEDRVVDRSIVVRDVRYFLPRELAFLLSVSGFELAGTAPLAGQPDPAWLRLAWARKA